MPERLPLTAPDFDESEIDGVRAVLESRWVTQGPVVGQFEALVADQQSVTFALATTSCTAALHLAALALGLGRGDEVIVPAFTWITSANAAEYVGAKPVFADVRADTFNLDPAALESAITRRTRAIMAVHLFGLAADMEAIMRVAQQHKLYVIEDAACAIGTTFQGRPVGGIGDVGCFSFHPRKIVTTGEGGMVTTNRIEIADRVKSLRNHGATGMPSPIAEAPGPWTMGTFDNLGYNLRLSDIQAAVGVAQMAKLTRLLAHRRSCAARYGALLAEVADLALPPGGPGAEGHTYQSYVVRIREGGRARRNRIMAHLERQGIQTRPGTHAVPGLGYYREKYGVDPAEFPVAVDAENTSITLPIFPTMTKADQDRVATELIAAIKS